MEFFITKKLMFHKYDGNPLKKKKEIKSIDRYIQFMSVKKNAWI